MKAARVREIESAREISCNLKGLLQSNEISQYAHVLEGNAEDISVCATVHLLKVTTVWAKSGISPRGWLRMHGAIQHRHIAMFNTTDTMVPLTKNTHVSY